MTAQQLEQQSSDVRKVVNDYIAALMREMDRDRAAELLRDIAFPVEVAVQELEGQTNEPL